MRRYFFDLETGGRGYVDSLGVSLPDNDSAAAHARRVAAELVRNREKKTRFWQVEVRDESRELVAAIPLSTQDGTLQHLSPPLKKSVEEMSRRRHALQQALEAARITQRKSKALVARSRGKPHLAAEQGEAI